MEKTQKLLRMAEETFPTLTAREESVVVAAGSGGIVDCGGDIIRVDLLRYMCSDQEIVNCIDAHGLRIHQAKLAGALDLSFLRVPFPIALLNCQIPQGLKLQSAEIRVLNLTGCHSGPIEARAITVAGDILFRNGFRSAGEVNLDGAHVKGHLICDGGSFVNEHATALSADGARIEGDVHLSQEFHADGEVRLLGASIGGQLNCEGGKFNNPQNNALSADRIRVGEVVSFSKQFSAQGEVRLLGGTIGGSLNCQGGQFNSEDNALNGDRLKVDGSMFLNEGFCAHGTVRLLGAHVNGQLACDGARIISKHPDALAADRINVGESVFLKQFVTNGRVVLNGGNIGGSLIVEGSEFLGSTQNGLIAKDVVIRGYLRWTDIKTNTETELSLRDAKVDRIEDDEHSWPSEGHLDLDGLIYGAIKPADAKTRIAWLRRQRSDFFSPQSYQQLSLVFRKSGREADRKRVAIAKEQARLEHGNLGFWSKGWMYLSGATIRYGYSPALAILWALAFISLGWGIFEWGQSKHLMSRTQAYIRTDDGGFRQWKKAYHNFDALGYSLDVFVPIVNFHQVEHWLPDPDYDAGHMCYFRCGRVLLWYLWFHSVIGWVITTLFVLALSGLVRED